MCSSRKLLLIEFNEKATTIMILLYNVKCEQVEYLEFGYLSIKLSILVATFGEEFCAGRYALCSNTQC